jgi:hypothetical protein
MSCRIAQAYEACSMRSPAHANKIKDMGPSSEFDLARSLIATSMPQDVHTALVLIQRLQSRWVNVFKGTKHGSAQYTVGSAAFRAKSQCAASIHTTEAMATRPDTPQPATMSPFAGWLY